MANNRVFGTSVGILLASVLLIRLVDMRGTVEVVEKRLDEIPFQIAEWNGHDIPMERRVIDELDTDVYVNRVYSSEGINPRRISLYIGYYGTKKGGRTGHNPYACLPSQGWAIIQEKKVPIRVVFGNQKEKLIHLNRLLVRGQETNQLVYHWYQTSGGTVLSSGIGQNINRFWKRIIYNRNDGAFIQVISVLSEDATKATDKSIQEFIKALFPLLVKYWPVEKERES